MYITYNIYYKYPFSLNLYPIPFKGIKIIILVIIIIQCLYIYIKKKLVTSKTVNYQRSSS